MTTERGVERLDLAELGKHEAPAERRVQASEHPAQRALRVLEETVGDHQTCAGFENARGLADEGVLPRPLRVTGALDGDGAVHRAWREPGPGVIGEIQLRPRVQPKPAIPRVPFLHLPRHDRQTDAALARKHLRRIPHRGAHAAAKVHRRRSST